MMLCPGSGWGFFGVEWFFRLTWLDAVHQLIYHDNMEWAAREYTDDEINQAGRTLIKAMFPYKPVKEWIMQDLEDFYAGN